MSVQNILQKEVSDFITGSNVATIGCCEHKLAHSFCCFYAFDCEKMFLIFKSRPTSRHSEILRHNPFVSGTIVSAPVFILNNKGIQFEGCLVSGTRTDRRHYYLKYPFAMTVAGELYTIRIDTIKFAATVSGLGTKLQWSRENKMNNDICIQGI
jgi:uncharacterized protein YhbP (UPF0306 family)